MKRILTLLLLALMACNSPLGQENGISLGPPGISVNQMTAKVGEPVRVTLTANFTMFSDSGIPQDTIDDVRLGPCIRKKGFETPPGPLCSDGERPSPAWVSVPDGEVIVKDFGDLVVKRGETRVIKHTFTFTASEPGEVAISSTVQYTEEGYDKPLADADGPAVVTFE